MLSALSLGSAAVPRQASALVWQVAQKMTVRSKRRAGLTAGWGSGGEREEKGRRVGRREGGEGEKRG